MSARIDADALAQVAVKYAKRSAQVILNEGHSPHLGPRGAAVLTRNGTIVGASEFSEQHGAGCGAERSALYRARIAGAGMVVAILTRGGKTGRSNAGPPSAATLQVILELAPRAKIFWGTDRKPEGGHSAKELLPGAFDKAHLSPR